MLFNFYHGGHRLIVNVFQSNCTGMLLVKNSLYLSSKFVGKFSGNVVVGV